MKLKSILPAFTLASILFISCKNDDKKDGTEESAKKEVKLKEDNVSYTVDTVTMDGYVVYDENKDGPRPAVIVIHEWWGLNDYSKMRARELAKLGYIAMAMDMYGNGLRSDDPAGAEKLAVPFYMKPELAKPRFDAALAKLKTYSQTNATKVAAIGYCFGGAQVLNLARMGEDLKGVVSFHGNLAVTSPDKNLLKSDILVCHGAADPFVPQAEVDKFRKQMDSIGAQYTFKAYEGATHSFTNPKADEYAAKYKMPVKYDAKADSASWKDMQDFFGKIFQ